jgi:hypothetical protein
MLQVIYIKYVKILREVAQSTYKNKVRANPLRNMREITTCPYASRMDTNWGQNKWYTKNDPNGKKTACALCSANGCNNMNTVRREKTSQSIICAASSWNGIMQYRVDSCGARAAGVYGMLARPRRAHLPELPGLSLIQSVFFLVILLTWPNAKFQASWKCYWNE